ncbi:hypothetical protein G5I_05642 [Acromyrmex echinatior]|uniref:Uncharacterized protein n=1 Tax=Acromyrmex echinatior TaxID=103372 RepID=F4WIW6_ACREC|nr:hypothetical protein G5I_05642 [Acromyrmex echinatior]
MATIIGIKDVFMGSFEESILMFIKEEEPSDICESTYDPLVNHPLSLCNAIKVDQQNCKAKTHITNGKKPVQRQCNDTELSVVNVTESEYSSSNSNYANVMYWTFAGLPWTWKIGKTGKSQGKIMFVVNLFHKTLNIQNLCRFLRRTTRVHKGQRHQRATGAMYCHSVDEIRTSRQRHKPLYVITELLIEVR